MWKALGKLALDTKAAVAPTVALSLFALIASGGIAFDYARLAAMDTELQQAADQAALAAATQLDGSDGARVRATAAAQSLLSNNTLFASDAGADSTNARRVTTASVNFYQSYDDATDTYGTSSSNDINARVVRVAVAGRTAEYALTPVVAALSSGTIGAEAAASLGSAVCNVPPLMMCAPGTGEFPTAADIGIGVLLQPGPNVGPWAPGDYGYLDFGNGSSGVKINLGRNNEAGGCTANNGGIPTEPGNKASVTDALNSRFDLYPAGSTNCSNGSGDYCPAENTRKDLAMTEEVDVDGDAPPAAPPANPGCGAAGAKVVSSSNSTDRNGFVQTAATKGFPRDGCHINETCGKFGTGVWGAAAYFAAAHPTIAAPAGSASWKRYDVYKWELADKVNRMPRTQADVTADPVPFKEQGNSGKGKYTFTNQCGYPFPVSGTGVPSSGTQKDRRVVTVAAVDCTGLNGKSDVTVKQWVDMFLVEPSLDRTAPYATGKSQIYGEIIGIAQKPDGSSAFQFYLKQRPRLLR